VRDSNNSRAGVVTPEVGELEVVELVAVELEVGVVAKRFRKDFRKFHSYLVFSEFQHERFQESGFTW
jgi:hypothetical protein